MQTQTHTRSRSFKESSNSGVIIVQSSHTVPKFRSDQRSTMETLGHSLGHRKACYVPWLYLPSIGINFGSLCEIFGYPKNPFKSHMMLPCHASIWGQFSASETLPKVQ